MVPFFLGYLGAGSELREQPEPYKIERRNPGSVP